LGDAAAWPVQVRINTNFYFFIVILLTWFA
jgi:hypothetical protein